MKNEANSGAMFGRGIAAVITTFFGFTWLGWGFSALPGLPRAVLPAYFVAAAALMVFALSAVRRGRAMVKAQRISRNGFWERRRKAFGLVAVLEGVGCIVVLVLAGVFNRGQWAAVGVSLVTALHLLPLGRIFESAACYWTGGLMACWDIATLIALKSWDPTASAGVATGLILWAAAIYLLIRSFPESTRNEPSKGD